jgi:(p)ppGpp synthase/HD superfamily hydrolase
MEKDAKVEPNKFALALDLVMKEHKDQKDKAGNPYIFHLLGVARQARTDDEFIVGLLHDFVEDGKKGTREDRLKIIYDNFGQVIGDAIEALSMKDDEDREAYIHRVGGNALAKAVKYHDLANNTDPERLKLLDKNEQDRLLEKYNKDKEQLISDTRHSEFWEWMHLVSKIRMPKEEFEKLWLSDWDEGQKK